MLKIKLLMLVSVWGMRYIHVLQMDIWMVKILLKGSLRSCQSLQRMLSFDPAFQPLEAYPLQYLCKCVKVLSRLFMKYYCEWAFFKQQKNLIFHCENRWMFNRMLFIIKERTRNDLGITVCHYFDSFRFNSVKRC